MASHTQFQQEILAGIPQKLPPAPPYDEKVSHAPKRKDVLSSKEKRLALQNALRYFPSHLHEALAPEFAHELKTYGRIYMYRYRPTYAMYARPLDLYPARCKEAAAIQLMIQNNLDPKVAQHPHELVTYGGNGAVFQNWAQYRLTMQYLAQMEENQTLVLYSGHPMGLFPSSPRAPRVVVTNGMVIPNYSSVEHYDRFSALGVTSYGQMTAGSFMYIGPQGIVHGTTITLLNAGRLYLNTPKNLAGKLYVTSGLGGMSGAQGKAVVIAGGVGIIAEVNPQAAHKRHAQGWVDLLSADLNEVTALAQKAREEKKPLAIAYLGNIVDLWEHLLAEGVKVDLGSDQTSLHLPWSGGYYPVGLTYDEANTIMVQDPDRFKRAVQASLVRQVEAINALVERGMHFWDYGNAFLLESSRAGANILKPDGSFLYPSYVEEIMGPICFDYGFGPFRWVCTSGSAQDLEVSDRIAEEVLREQRKTAPEEIQGQIHDNIQWIVEAGKNRMVVGSQARILYADALGRISIARAFNRAIAQGRITAPIVLGRDHHDVSGTDSPYRETANIKDGSMFTADMAVHNVIGDAMRGASWVSIHNGGGVGWGEVMNGGFGLLLDGSEKSETALEEMLFFDVNNGIARRAWAGNPNAVRTAARTQEANPGLRLTRANPVLSERLLDQF